jgi:hypothetical protein
VTRDRTRARWNPQLGVERAAQTAIEAFKKIQKTFALYFMGKNMSRVPYRTPDW